MDKESLTNTLFWKIVLANWTVQERLDLRANVEAWMAADKSARP